jgi:hypothetical protein
MLLVQIGILLFREWALSLALVAGSCFWRIDNQTKIKQLHMCATNGQLSFKFALFVIFMKILPIRRIPIFMLQIEAAL